MAIPALAAVLLPPLYLVVRAAEADARAWDLALGARTLATMGRTVGLALAVTALSVAVAVPLAWLTARTDLPLRRFWATATALPLVVPSYIGAYLLVAAFGPRGMLQAVLEPLGVDRIPSIYGFPGALLALVLFTYPYPLLLARAALARMDPAIEAASRTLGAGPWRTLWRVTLPQLRPALGAGGLLVALYVLRDFGAVSIMRYDTFTRVIFVQYRSAFDRHGAALLALVLVALTGAVLVLEQRAAARARYHHAAGVAARRAAPVRLGRWRWPATLYCAGVTGLALGVPAALLAYWLARGVASGEAPVSLWDETWHTLVASGLGALVTLAVATPIALLVARRPGRPGRWLARLAWSSHALPGIVVALALVFFSLRAAKPLYQTLILLVMAYLIQFLPQAVGAVGASLRQIHPSLAEAARTLGRRPARVFGTITLPLIAPGIGAALALVLLTAMKELPATLILSPIGFDTLAVEVWSAVSEAYFARAAAPALLLVLLAALPMAWLSAGEAAEVA